VLELARPYNIADMTDDYQEARLISEDSNSITVEVTYYPINNHADSIGENANWKRDYAGMPYTVRPHNISDTYVWTVKDGVTVRAGAN